MPEQVQVRVREQVEVHNRRVEVQVDMRVLLLFLRELSLQERELRPSCSRDQGPLKWLIRSVQSGTPYFLLKG